MKNVPQEGCYTKIGALAGVVAVLLAYLAWQPPKSDRAKAPPAGATTAANPKPATDDVPGKTQSPLGVSLVAGKSAQSCETPETATLGTATPVRVASGLVTLSVTPGRLGSEEFLTLGISSDRETRAEMVLGAPVRYSFKTSLGTYIVNVTKVNFEANTMSVDVGCEPKGTSR